MQIVINETICIKCQILFSEKNKKNNSDLSSAELAFTTLVLDFDLPFHYKWNWLNGKGVDPKLHCSAMSEYL